jgi:hypothetical protein
MLRCTSDVTFPATTGCITISGGPAGNTFSRMRLTNSAAAIAVFGVAAESDILGGQGPGPYRPAADGNTFENCIFDRCVTAIQLHWYADDNLDRDTDVAPFTIQEVTYNQFYNCTFAASTDPSITTYFIWSERESLGNGMLNCIIANFDVFWYGRNMEGTFPAGMDYAGHNFDYTPFTPGFLYSHCCFSNAFAMPAGPGNKNANPKFKSSGFYELSTTLPKSPCIDAGYYYPYYFYFPGDFDGSSRLVNGVYDMGAQEAQNN